MRSRSSHFILCLAHLKLAAALSDRLVFSHRSPASLTHTVPSAHCTSWRDASRECWKSCQLLWPSAALLTADRRADADALDRQADADALNADVRRRPHLDGVRDDVRADLRRAGR